jgi:leader peptidase (prepilin peptidase)/N-methyltransferase
MSPSADQLVVAGGVLGAVLGPWLAATTVRLADGDPAARPAPSRVVVTAVLTAAAGAAAPAIAGARPAAVTLAWFGAAAVVLAGVDVLRHRLPDRVSYPAAAVCTATLVADAAVTGAWGAVLRAVLAALLALALAAGARLLSPAGLGLGDVKLLGLLGLVLGWAGWGVLTGGVFAGVLIGALASLVLLATGRAGWRTRVPFGPPLLAGAYVALWLTGPLPGS